MFVVFVVFVVAVVIMVVVVTAVLFVVVWNHMQLCRVCTRFNSIGITCLILSGVLPLLLCVCE